MHAAYIHQMKICVHVTHTLSYMYMSIHNYISSLYVYIYIYTIPIHDNINMHIALSR